MQSELKSRRVSMALAAYVISGLLCVKVCGTYLLLVLVITGMPDSALDRLNFMSRILVFPLFLISLASLRWSFALLWADFLLGWVAGLIAGWPVGRLSPFSASGSASQFIAALLMTSAYFLICEDRSRPISTKRSLGLIKLLRGK